MLPEVEKNRGENAVVQCIEHVSELAAYAPPGHSGTVNRRLVDASFNGAFEMILGEIEPGGAAAGHAHAAHHQCMYVLEGEAEMRLGEATRRCGPGTIIRIPPGLEHEVRSVGPQTLRLIVLYSPPLAPREEKVIA
jgi:quercetin dioxygenase-like cupin family protein